MSRRCAWLLITPILYGLPVAAMAFEYSYSGFGTIGYARSNQPYTYQRFIDDGGTLKRDSVAGLQLDTKFADQFGATVQAKIAAATASDSRFEGSISWAFLSYRPTNDWLIRGGKQRIPLYLYSETYDVGTTYDFARLPTEMYSIVPSNDFTGLSFSKNWPMQRSDISLDVFWGKSKNDFRFWLRDGIPGLYDTGATFEGLDFKLGGLALSYRAKDQLLRLGVGRAIVRRRNGLSFLTGFPFVEIAPGIGYYQVDASLPGPGVPSVRSVVNNTMTLGADLALPSDLRVVSEFARSLVPNSEIAPQGNRGYLSLLRRFNQWTPYVTYAFLRSASRTRDLYRRVNGNTVPGFIPAATQINASQRVGADQIIAYDQHAWALGTSYSFTAKSKLKAEYLRTRIGGVSQLVDAPSGSNISNRNINVISVSYSFVF